MKKLFLLFCIVGWGFGFSQENPNQKDFKQASKTEKFAQAHPLKGESEGKLKGSLINLGDYGVDDFGYVSVPDQEPIGGVVLIHEWWGLNQHIKKTADLYASRGYVALAVDLYNGTVTDDATRAGVLMRELNQKSALKLIGAGIRCLKESPKFKVPQVATVGWCMGGGLSLQAALENEKLDAAVIYYGPTETDRNKVTRLKVPLLGIYATQDEWVKIESVNEFEKMLIDLKKPHKFLKMEAVHAFANPSNAKYNPELSEQAFKEVMSFLYKVFTTPKKEGFFEKIF